MTPSSPKLVAMREWVAALRAYDELQAPYQLRGSDPPTAEVTARLDDLSIVVEGAFERYQALSWASTPTDFRTETRTGAA